MEYKGFHNIYTYIYLNIYEKAIRNGNTKYRLLYTQNRQKIFKNRAVPSKACFCFSVVDDDHVEVVEDDDSLALSLFLLYLLRRTPRNVQEVKE